MAEQKSQEAVSIISRGSSYFRESVEELRKVARPSRQETVQATIVTIVIICVVAVCLMALDVVFDHVMAALLGGGLDS